MPTIVETYPEAKPTSSIAYRSLERGDYFLYNNVIYQICENGLCHNVLTGREARFECTNYILPIKRLTITYTT